MKSAVAIRLAAILSMLAPMEAVAKKKPEPLVDEEALPGPTNYHATYSAITQLPITLGDWYLRLSDGTTIYIPRSRQEIDMLKLTGLGRGLNLSTFGMTFPGNAQSTDVVEIRIVVPDGTNNRCVFTDSTLSPLRIWQAEGVTKNKRVDFLANNRKDLLVLHAAVPITITSDQNYFVKVSLNPLRDVELNATPAGLDCRLGNRRFQIQTIIRPSDEF